MNALLEYECVCIVALNRIQMMSQWRFECKQAHSKCSEGVFGLPVNSVAKKQQTKRRRKSNALSFSSSLILLHCCFAPKKKVYHANLVRHFFRDPPCLNDKHAIGSEIWSIE